MLDIITRAGCFCGIDGKLIECKKHYEEVDGEQVDIGYVGEITKVNTDMLKIVAQDAYIPVIAPIGIGPDGESYNINADTAAARIAGMLGAESLIMMTDIRGVLEDKDDPESLIKKIVVSEVRQLMNRGIISGGMIPKVECCVEAIRRGVHKVFVVDGRVPHCTLMELFTDDGMGTMFVGG